MSEDNFSWLTHSFTTYNQSNVSIENYYIPLFDEHTKMDKYMISYYLMGVSTLCICCFGALGNILSLCVLTRRSVGSLTTNLYLISLAIADLLVLFATILTAIKDSRKPMKDQLVLLSWQDAPFVPRSYPYFHATAIMFQVTSVWLTVAFTSDRYMMICHPFVAKRWCTVKLAKFLILSINLTSLIYGIPRYFEYTEFEIYLPPGFLVDSEVSKASGSNYSTNVNNRTEQRVIWYDLSDFGRSESFRNIYHLWSWNLLVVGIPLLTIAIMNSFLIREVRRSNSRGAKQNQRREARRQETDIMLIGVIVIFFICQTPAAVSHISWAVIPPNETQKLFWFLLNEIGNLLIVVNSAINLLPYYIFSRRFRRQFTQMFCPFRIVRENGLHCIYIPRWAADNLAKYASDNAGTTGALGGCIPINKGIGLRHTLYACGGVRQMSIMPPVTPGVTENAQLGKSANRNSTTRPERFLRYSEQTRASCGAGRLSHPVSDSRIDSVPKLYRASLKAISILPEKHEIMEDKFQNDVRHSKECSQLPHTTIDFVPIIK
ncbi:FMRFamide receptor [Fasciola hepatica]|uniref:FMRFamide receptor n=1 Tax=Fasciola hepatica TaxID=6192 RepID=A0A4E0R4Z2_FASHE|nr:FMRFamide receptor [Fasciola hepatica]